MLKSQGISSKKVVKPAHRRELAGHAQSEYGISVRIACKAMSIIATCYAYQAKLSDENKEIEDWLLRLTSAHKRWGFGL